MIENLKKVTVIAFCLIWIGQLNPVSPQDLYIPSTHSASLCCAQEAIVQPAVWENGGLLTSIKWRVIRLAVPFLVFATLGTMWAEKRSDNNEPPAAISASVENKEASVEELKNASAAHIYLWTQQKTLGVSDKLARLKAATELLSTRMNEATSKDPTTQQALFMGLNNLWALEWMTGDKNFLQAYSDYIKIRYGRTPTAWTDMELANALKLLKELGMYDQIIKMISESRPNRASGTNDYLSEPLAWANLAVANYQEFIEKAGKSPLVKTAKALQKSGLKATLAPNTGDMQHLSHTRYVPATVYIASDDLDYINPSVLAYPSPLMLALMQKNKEGIISIFDRVNIIFDYLSGGTFSIKVQDIVFRPPKPFSGKGKPQNALDLAASEIRDGKDGFKFILGYGTKFQDLFPHEANERRNENGYYLGSGVILGALDNQEFQDRLASENWIAYALAHEILHALGGKHPNEGPFLLLNSEDWKQRIPASNEGQLLESTEFDRTKRDINNPLVGIMPETAAAAGWDPVEPVELNKLLNKSSRWAKESDSKDHHLRAASFTGIQLRSAL